MFTLGYDVRQLRKAISSVDMEVKLQTSITLERAVRYDIISISKEYEITRLHIQHYHFYAHK
jgi:hypothetical protein